MMIRTMLSGLAAVATLAMGANAPAQAQKIKVRGGAETSHAGGNTATASPRRAQSGPKGSQKLSGSSQPQNFPAHAAAIHALSLYYRRCLDNILPECPK